MKIEVNDKIAVDVKWVFLDNVEQTGCYLADTEAGKICRFKNDESGFCFIENGEIAKEELYGKVIIVMKDGTVYE